MPQIKISLDETILDFVRSHEKYGFASKSEIVANALMSLKNNLETQTLIESAKLYREIYDSDPDLQELTDSAASSCLE